MKFMQTYRINPAFECLRVLPNTADVICGCSLVSNRRGSETTCEIDPSPCTSTMGRKEGGMIKVARHSGHVHTVVSAERGRDGWHFALWIDHQEAGSTSLNGHN